MIIVGNFLKYREVYRIKIAHYPKSRNGNNT